MVEPYAIQDMARQGVHLVEQQMAFEPGRHGHRFIDLSILRNAIEDERFRALIQWKIEEFQRCGS
jgi:hypothetical protein